MIERIRDALRRLGYTHVRIGEGDRDVTAESAAASVGVYLLSSGQLGLVIVPVGERAHTEVCRSMEDVEREAASALREHERTVAA